MKRFLYLLVLGLCAFAANAASPESAVIAEARELVDSYYGQGAKLAKAAQLVEAAHQANPRDANVFVLAARITVMRAGLADGDDAPDVWKAYDGLLDKAIALDPALPKAYILKAEVAQHARRYNEMLRMLEKAKWLGTDDPWLLIGYAEYYRLVKSPIQAYDTLEELIARGPGTDASDRKAYVRALRLQVGFRVNDEDVYAKMRRNAALALKARHPDDAWSPRSFAEVFLSNFQFDDAIRYSRESLKISDSRAARRTLAASLYAKAAQHRATGGSATEVAPYVGEAAHLGFSKSSIMEYLLEERDQDGNMEVLKPMLEQVIP